jgi:hypothetical protein
VAEFDIDKQIVHVLNAWGKTLVRDMKKAINTAIAADGGGQTSNLSGSVEFNVKQERGLIRFQLTMNDYWDFVDKGVDGTEKNWGSPYKFKGKNINQKAMIDFVKKRHFNIEVSTKQKGLNKSIRNKGIRKAHKKLSIENARKSLAFLIGRKLAREGKEPLHFWSKVINQERIDELKDMLRPLIKQEITINLAQ